MVGGLGWGQVVCIQISFVSVIVMVLCKQRTRCILVNPK
ncbi:putative membrane protein [Rhodoferax antarcticus ANT.BR]|uniref:Putative membrane protein n=1 Tax=Rhodoferax antarcticus ANT.BR TaxID=1111071 RepID=A0A1Q8YFZ0_9BURK|nr:putative membrane protein [Rhodoferax antarcticus ANT.BR]